MKASVGKVLILLENNSFPADERVRLEAKALTEGGYKVAVICPKGRSYDTKSYEMLNDVAVYRYTPWEFGTSFLSYSVEYLKAIISATFLCAIVYVREGFDVVHLCNPPDLLFLVALPYRCLGKKVIFDHHDLSPELYLTKKQNGTKCAIYKLMMLFEKLSLKTANVVISTNESYRNVAVSRGKVPEENVFVVRNGPDMSRIKKVEPNPRLKGDKRHLIFYVGIMGKQDGIDYLLRSIHILVHIHRRDDFHVLLVGSGSELEKLKSYAHELQIDDVVTFTGHIPDAEYIQALSTADVCTCPDPKTPLNNVCTMIKTMEYMAAGKSIVAYDLRETRVSAGDAALYATPNDEESFGNKIAELLDSPDLRKKLGKIGEDRIHNKLSWEHSKKDLYAAYSRALNKRKTDHR